MRGHPIAHRRRVLPWLIDVAASFGAVARQSYFETIIGDDGITISKLLRAPVTIPWVAIACVDLAQLSRFALHPALQRHWTTWLIRLLARNNRSFSIMSREGVYFNRRAFFYGGAAKIWRPGCNVLAVCDIASDAAAAALPVLTALAAARGIEITSIVLDWPEDV